MNDYSDGEDDGTIHRLTLTLAIVFAMLISAAAVFANL